MQKITTFLWFNDNAEEAMSLYTSIFPDSKLLSVSRYGDAGPGPKGQVMTANFLLHGHEFIVLNGGPQFTFTPAVSFVVNCEDQAEVDHYWDKLLAGGGLPNQCGWLQDKFGLSWQITPRRLTDLMNEGGETAKRAFEAMMEMRKIDIAKLDAAVAGVKA